MTLICDSIYKANLEFMSADSLSNVLNFSSFMYVETAKSINAFIVK